MKKKHLWFLLPTAFAMIFVESLLNNVPPSLLVLSLVCVAYTFVLALDKNM